jgi:hypothetical protein
MLDINQVNYHLQYAEMTTQHWHPSQPYARGDQLMTALEKGWVADQDVQVKRVFLGDDRSICVFEFTLRRKGQTMVMPVVENPYVRRYCSTAHYQLIGEAIDH